MAKDRDGAALGANQSKKPAMPPFDLGDQPVVQQQHVPQLHHRVKSQKHLVGGATGGRVHARIPSAKGLHKHHAATASAKLNRRHGSLSPDRAGGLALASHHHRRATSELKLTGDSSSTNLKKNASHTNLKRNRSQGEVGKRTKSTTSLHRSGSNPAVDRLRGSLGSARVQFDLGDEGQEEEQDDDEWVDASTSASPLLSRRGSAVSSAHPANKPEAVEGSPAAPPPPIPCGEDARPMAAGTQNGTQNSAQHTANSPSRETSNHNQYLTSRILSRTPSHGAPPKMSTETVSVRPASSRQHSPPDSSFGQGPSLSTTPATAAQVRPGSSGKAELTSRFVGHNSQEPGSGVAGESFIQAANRGGLSRAALNGIAAAETAVQPKRRQSLGAMSQGRGIDVLNARQAASRQNGSDDEDEEDAGRVSRTRRIGDYAMPTDMNRTQQKLNLQRASSSLEAAHPHPGIGIGPPGVPGAAGPLLGVPTTYDSRDPRIGKLLERTGMEYLTVRRHLNPVARSVSRVMQLPDLENSRRIPRSGGPPHQHASRLSEQFNPSQQRELVTRNSSMADLLGGGTAGRRPPTPRGGGSGGGGAFSGLHSASSSLGTDDDASKMHERRALSGTSLVNGAEDAETMALLRMMWDKTLDLSASQD